MGSDEKKLLKAKAKAEKKLAKVRAKAAKIDSESSESCPGAGAEQVSGPVRFAEFVRGILFLITSVSMVVAIILSNKGYIVKLDDLIENLILLWAGKAVLFVIAVALFIYGLKNLRAIK